MRKNLPALAAAAVLAVAPLAVVTTTAQAHTTGIHDNCTKFNAKYPHGVGTRTARDRVKSRASDPVTNFKRSNKIYWAAENHNGSLDLDNDRVACEKH